MNPNLSTNFAAIQVERSLLDAQAERDWQAIQVTHRPSLVKAIEARIGIALVAVGERLQGLPRSAAVGGPTQATR